MFSETNRQRNKVKKMLNKITLFVAIFFSGLFAAHAQEEQSWWNSDVWKNPDRGFNWYPPDAPPKKEEPKKEEPKKEEEKKVEVKKAEVPKDIKKMKTVAEIKVEVNRLRDVAIMNPTQENMYAYLSANQYVMDKSAYFTDMWRRTVWQNPEIDYNVRSPQANFAQVALKDSKNMQSDALMARLSKTHGIVFFFRSDCEFCHMQAPIVRMLKDQYQIEVLPVSLDGRGIKEFPQVRPDNGISMVLSRGRGIDTVPAMFLVSRDKKEIVPLGAGVLAMDEMVERIRVLYATKPGDDF